MRQIFFRDSHEHKAVKDYLAGFFPMAPTTLPPIPLALALLLAGHGLRKGSLSKSGAFTAFLVGVSMCAVPLRTFAVSLIGFYLLGSRATKVGKTVKRKLEEGYDVGSKRNGFQVLCNSFSAFVASSLWSAAFVEGERDVFATLTSVFAEFAQVPRRRMLYESTAWCVIDGSVNDGWSRKLVFAALGYVRVTSNINNELTLPQSFCVLSRRHLGIGARNSIKVTTHSNYYSTSCTAWH
jgi:hypothetical protein